jgi:hypothetical protein
MRTLYYVTLLLTLLSCAEAAADEKADARALLDKAIAAHGGEERLAKHVAYHVKLKVEYPLGDKTITAAAELYTQGFDKARTTVVYETAKGQVVEVVNGKTGWIKRDDSDAQVMTDEQVAKWHEDIYAKKVGQLAPLKNRDFDLSSLDEIMVEGRPAVGILVRHEGHEAIKLYFDKESHLLVKSWRRTMNVTLRRESVHESVILDYREVNGEKHPFKSTSYRDGSKLIDSTVTSIEVFDKPLDEKHFDKP